jgi:non-ribosomal peptide synthetase component F
VVPQTVAAASGGEGAPQVPVSADVARLVRDVARRYRVTAFLVFAAVYATTIARFSDATRVPVAVASHGRGAPGLARVAGVFSTLFVLPTDLTGDTSFGEFLTRLHPTYRACLANRNVTLAELALERKLSREPFFRHVISYHPAGFAVRDFAGMPAAMDIVSAKPAPNELEFHVREVADAYVLQLRFDPAVLDAGAARAVLDDFGRRLASFATDPDRGVAPAAVRA